LTKNTTIYKSKDPTAMTKEENQMIIMRNLAARLIYNTPEKKKMTKLLP